MNPIAVTLLTGFLGAGKTTLLRHILNEQHGYKIAVIENEFGEVSVDDQLIGDRATQIKTLTNGCICRSRSNELETHYSTCWIISTRAIFSSTVWSLNAPAWPIPARLFRPFSPMRFYASVTCWTA